jgi:hypothetical protein
MKANACDIFSYNDKKNIHVLLSFFQFSDTRARRYIQFDKKIFSFKVSEKNNIPQIINLYLKENYSDLFVYALKKSFAMEIATSIEVKKELQSLSTEINKIGLFALLSKINHQKSTSFKPNKNNVEVSISTANLANKEYAYKITINKSKSAQFSGNKTSFEENEFCFMSKDDFEKYVINKIVTHKSILSCDRITLNLSFVSKNQRTILISLLKKSLKSNIDKNIPINCEHISMENIRITDKDREIHIENIEKYKNKCLELNNNHILYTDGSVIGLKSNKYICGAYLIHNEKGYKHGSEVLDFNSNNPHNSGEAELLAFYLGLNEMVKLGLTDKMITFITDSDVLSDFIQTQNDYKTTVLDNVVKYKISKLLKIIGKNYNLITIKSHKTNSNKIIEKHNNAVDRLAYNSIVDFLNNNNIENTMKKRA